MKTIEECDITYSIIILNRRAWYLECVIIIWSRKKFQNPFTSENKIPINIFAEGQM